MSVYLCFGQFACFLCIAIKKQLCMCICVCVSTIVGLCKGNAYSLIIDMASVRRSGFGWFKLKL